MRKDWRKVMRQVCPGSLVLLFILSVSLSGMFVSCGSGASGSGEQVDSTALRASEVLFGISVDSLKVESKKVERGQILSVILSNYGMSQAMIYQLVQVCDSVFDVRSIRVGQPYTAMLMPDSTHALRYLVYEKSEVEFVVFDLNPQKYNVYTQKRPIRVERRHVTSAINSSLWNTVVEKCHKPELAISLSEIFAWQIDFFGIAKGDSFSVIYDELYVDTTLLGPGDIRAAYFKHQGKDFYAFPFVEEDSVRTFFDENGQSLRKAFLKSPLKYFSRISSGFSNSRFHPILKIFRAHHGVDYAARMGTPILSIGDGVVVKKAYQRAGGGHYLYIKHNATYTTSYMHMSDYASGTGVGARVKQGQVIGFVGRSGLASGPHLDFRVYLNGSAINPLKMESPPTNPVREHNMPRFTAMRDSMMKELKKL